MPDTGADIRTARRRAVVIGGSTAGMLAASVLATRFHEVTVVEADRLPAGPEPRKGLPQARHAHLLWSGGVSALEDLLPGITGELTGQGAGLVGVMADLVSKAPSGQWFRRFTDSRHHLIVCSRDLLDAVIRGHVLARPRITLLDGTRAAGLTGGHDRVTGLRLLRGSDGRETTLDADLVIDAGGRGSQAATWLRALGHAPVAERVVDAGVVYASRLYAAPDGTLGRRYPVVNVQADPREAPGRGGVVVPIEDDRWLVTLSGTRGGQPTADPDAFEHFARTGLTDPIIGRLLARAKPLTDPVTTRSTANRRRYYEKSETWPEGFAVLGDAVAGYNPVYGHGLTVAAQSALALGRVLDRYGPTAPGAARRVQRAVARPVGNAWNLAVGQDAYYPGATSEPPTLVERMLSAYVDKAVAAGSGNPRALQGLLDVMSLKAPASRLFAPDMLWNIATGPRRAPLSGPPLSETERRAAGLN
ncbi:FAD-dependent oxidoreductase [Streptomyces broussonetiae]|uniref:Pyridine nucleotide-disulfide oxidoreductase n=1 Tax=Streptomyces broussonetiae TaxID=2686304 RepID=A0A6I6MZ25_9ACTN|nr:FAD-dependent monooxygenase [Streptomyces broussonetiae]QHA04354.1 pyridine nucleotide-disulfide oxidoreductase [Streptomyces broussonetiae]